MARPIDIHLPGGVILLTPPGLLPARLSHTHALCDVSALQRLRRDRTALAELRREFPMLGLPQDPRHTPVLALLEAVEAAVRRRRLDLHWLPRDTGQEVTQRAHVRSDLPASVRDWSWHEKIAEALRRALTARSMRRELQGLMRELVDPQNLLLALPLIAVMAIPGGGAVMAAFAYRIAGWAGLMAMLEFGRVTIACVQAMTQAEIDEAAEAYAKAIVALGASVLSRFVARLGTRGATAMGRAALKPKPKPAGSGQRPQQPEGSGGYTRLRRDEPTPAGEPPKKPLPTGRYERPPAASMTNEEARRWYHAQEDRIPDIIDKSAPKEAQARQAFEMRNEVRTAARDAMKDRAAADKLMREEPNKTWAEMLARKRAKGLADDQIYDDIVASAGKSREAVDAKLGIKRRGK